jgi:hypothetical protein
MGAATWPCNLLLPVMSGMDLLEAAPVLFTEVPCTVVPFTAVPFTAVPFMAVLSMEALSMEALSMEALFAEIAMLWACMKEALAHISEAGAWQIQLGNTLVTAVPSYTMVCFRPLTSTHASRS